jgi:hypothetical protein
MSSVPSVRQASAAGGLAYAVKNGDVSCDEAEITRLWREGGLGAHQDADHVAARFRWFYLHNPQGTARVSFLWSQRDARNVGVVAIGARHMVIDGETVVGGVLVDFVVIPTHRSAFPALTLQRQTRERAVQSMDVIYGLPDTAAVSVCKRLPTHADRPMQRWVRVVRSRVYLDRKLAPLAAAALAAFTDVLDGWGMRLQSLFTHLSGRWISEFDGSFDELWQSTPRKGVCMGVRNRQFLQWRFIDGPRGRPLIFSIRHTQSHRLTMYFVCELNEGSLAVKDYLNSGTERELRHGLLLLALASRKLGANAVSVETVCNERVRRALRRAQYVRRSERPFFAVFNESTAGRAAGCEWFITQADEDV